MRSLAVLAILAAIILTACSPASSPNVFPPPRASEASTANPSEAPQSATPVAWVRSDIDPNPGAVVVGLIGRFVRVPDAAVTAAVFMFGHPAGNMADIWVFRAAGVPSTEAIQRWIGAETRCTAASEPITLAGLATTVIRRRLADQCQPEYLVALDDRTVAMILDDGGYGGNGAQATPIPYRPADEIAQLVIWLQQNLSGIPPATGGPMPHNG
jgi:hypothetical protein